MSKLARPYQVVTWGATGFTGRLVCEHIARDYQGKIRWAMAGRDKAKLERLRSELANVNPECKDVPILIADATDAASLGAMLAQTDVVLTTAGPFARYGDNLVAQAVEQGTHYADITGEVLWVKRSIQKHHEAAVAKGVKILHCCGFDSIPSDLGTFMMVQHCKEQLGCSVSQMYTLLADASGGFSGGTLESLMNQNATEKREELRAAASDQYYLASLHGLRGPDRPASSFPQYIAPARTWTAPFVMEPVNARVVQTSNALLANSPYMYGKEFKYCEALSAPGPVVAGLISGSMGLIGMVSSSAPLRAIAKRYLPLPGQGPSIESCKSGHWKCNLVAVTDEEKPRIVRGVCSDRRDPGYWGTSRILLETGLVLALEAARLEADPGLARGGVLTPAAACGPLLLERLRAAGLTFEVAGVEGEGAAAE